MTDKSHVSMEQHRCLVCGQDYDTGNILLDRRLRQSLERNTITGMGLCPEHQKLDDDGFIALIGIDESKSFVGQDTVKFEDAYRTGKVAHLRRTAWPFDRPIPDSPFAFVADEVIDMLASVSTHKE